MGVVNVTPDSFSDGGRTLDPKAAIDRAKALIGEGADILDIGAESSRPRALSVSAEEELSRLTPVLEGLSDCAVPISVDTVKPEVMRAAIAAGASMINDIGALRAPGAMRAVAASDAGVCLMHMQGEPRTSSRARATATWCRSGRSSRNALRRPWRAVSHGSASPSTPVSGFGKTVAQISSCATSIALPRWAFRCSPAGRAPTLGAITGRGRRIARRESRRGFARGRARR
jgi:dihydropteroate synthase